MTAREQGTVKWYNSQRGCGFITRDGGGDIYINRRALPRTRRWDPDEGDRVEYEVRSSDKGLFAAQLEFLSITKQRCVYCDLKLAPNDDGFHAIEGGEVACTKPTVAK